MLYAELCTVDRPSAELLAEQAVDASRNSNSPYPATWERGMPGVLRTLWHVLYTAREWSASPGSRALLNPELLASLGDEATLCEEDQVPLRVLREMEPDDGELLWWGLVERLAAPELALNLGRSVFSVNGEVERVSAEFRDRSWLMYRLSMQDPCRSYFGLLDAAAGQRARASSPSLAGHLENCQRCTEAYACLSAEGESLASLLAEAAVPWGGSAYLRRRRAQPHPSAGTRNPGVGTRTAEEPRHPRHVPRARLGVVFGVLLVMVSAFALTSALSSDDSGRERAGGHGGMPTEPPAQTSSVPDTGRATPSKGQGSSESSRAPGRQSSSLHPSQSRSEKDEAPADERSDPPGCTARLGVVNTWKDGMQADLEISAGSALGQGWEVSFQVAPGTRLEQTWHGKSTAQGRRVSITADSYNQVVKAGAKLTVGMVIRGYPEGPWLSGLRVNGSACSLGSS
ncbi:cellulose binding domain-containing protein [Streptomyces sp. CA-250714]|uniref:cellulose binding domain-containing protein n=1 Tax=Streptomyces sp. CA-250714 TaxID=3240060 RepID=UPI003D8B9033